MKTTTNLLLALAATTVLAFSQGDLTPTAAPAPTMKTLTQIEPRTPVNSTTCPGDASNTYIIATPGSYYLTGNLTGTAGKRGIYLQSNNVTLDLGGFILDGNSAGTDAIYAINGNYTVFNGTITKWNGSGIYLIGDATRVEHITVTTCGQGIVSQAAASNVSDCAVFNIISAAVGTSVYGIQGDTVTHCTVKGVSTTAGGGSATGITGKTVSQCSVSDVQAANSTAIGISASTITDSSYVGKLGAASAASYVGITASTIAHCTVRDLLFNSSGNFDYGIVGAVITDSTVNRVSNTGSGTSVAGIHGNFLSNLASGSVETSVIKSCQVSGITGIGIEISGIVNLEGNRSGYCTSYGISANAGIVRNNTTNNCGTAIFLNTGLAVGNTSISDTIGFFFGAAVRSGPLITTGGVSTVFDPNSNFKF